jgi:hypothetical protein
VDLFKAVSPFLTVLAIVAVIWPLNVPLLAAAIKVSQGTGKLDYEPRELWLRSALGSFGLAVMGVLLLGFAYGLIEEAEFHDARGAIHLVLFLLYLPAGVAFLFWALALDDLVQAISIFAIYFLLPGVPLFLVGWLFGFWKMLAHSAPWLLSPT